MNIKDKDINNWNKNFNQDNIVGFEARSQPDYRRQLDQDKSYDNLNKLDWDKESYYHNSVRVNGKNNIGRTIKMNNKLWHKLNS